MKESKHDIAYFLTNHDFISWVKQPTKNSTLFWEKWVQNHPQDKEAFTNARIILKEIDFKEAAVSKEKKEKILDAILKEKGSALSQQYTTPKSPIHISSVRLYASVAAILLLLATVFFYSDSLQKYSNSEKLLTASLITKISRKGEKLAFYLPDSTKVILNSDSKITFPKVFDLNTRKVVLEGQAYFDVHHDTDWAFLVESNDIITSVHGTSFNVSAYKDAELTSVSLERGLVAVHPKEKQKNDHVFKILPGEKFTANKNFEASIKSIYEYEEEFGWKDGILVFKGANLETFISRTERWYDVTINIVGDIDEDWAMNGRFNNESLENVIKSLGFTKNLKYEIKGKQITLYLNTNFK